MIAYRVAIAIHAPGERTLTIDNDVVPWQLVKGSYGFHRTSHRRHLAYGPILMTNRAVIDPDIEIAIHVVPVPHSFEDLP
jgi:hypothetical protein